MVGSATLVDLAGILGLAAKAKAPLAASDPVVAYTTLVAGACNTLCLLLFAMRRIGWR
jgi:hypothetical protein